jgi:hypothetical protein
MLRMKYAKELITLLAAVFLLTGFTYAVRPGQLEMTPENIVFIQVRDFSTSQSRIFKDPAAIQKAIQLFAGKTAEQGTDWKNSNPERDKTYQLSIGYKDSAVRMYVVEFPGEGDQVFVHPYNKFSVYRVPKAEFEAIIK